MPAESSTRARIGVQLPQAGPNATLPFVREYIQRALDRGIRSLWVGEHIVMGGYEHRASIEGTFLDPLVLLAHATGLSPDVDVGTSVLIVPYRHPLVLAKGLTTLAHLTQGRLTVGVGAGWAEAEFATLGAPFARRGEVTDQFCEIFRRLQSDPGEPWTIGEYTFTGGGFGPPIPPSAELWIGGNSAAARRRVAKWGDGWQPMRVEPEELAAGVVEIREQCERNGRDPSAVRAGLRLRVRLGGDTPAAEVEASLSGYVEAGVEDFVIEINTRERERALDSIDRLAESCAALGILPAPLA